MSNYYGFDGLMDDGLQHYGIKNQKWGVRRYQNPDGTLTTEGKKRYRYLDKASKNSSYDSQDREFNAARGYPSRKNTTTGQYIPTGGYYTYGGAGYMNELARLDEELEELQKKENDIWNRPDTFETTEGARLLGKGKGNGSHIMYEVNTKTSDKANRSLARNIRNQEAVLDEMEYNRQRLKKIEDWLYKGADKGNDGDTYITDKKDSKKAIKNLIKEEFKEDWSVGASSIVNAGKSFVSSLFGKKKKK